jgi:hypothetical protein
MKYLLTILATLALAASAHAQQRFPTPNGGYAPGMVVLCISNCVAVPTSSGACDGGGVPVVVNGGVLRVTHCKANPLTGITPPLC